MGAVCCEALDGEEYSGDAVGKEDVRAAGTGEGEGKL